MTYDDDAVKPVPQKCDGCGKDKVCPGCDDVRPTAEDLYAGWLLRSPLERVETVERVEQEAPPYGPVRVWTKETGPDHCWIYPRWRKVDAVAPMQVFLGKPEIRIVEYEGRDRPMYAIATVSTAGRRPLGEGAGVLAEAGYSKASGWVVQDRPGGGDVVTIRCESKAKARTALLAAARAHGKALKVPVRRQEKSR